LALTISLAVDLRGNAVRQAEGASGRNVTETAQSRVSRASAGNGVPGSTAQASLDNGALASAVSLIVSLGRRARRDDESAGIGAVSKSAKSGVGRASTSGSVPGSSAQASQDNRALASAVSVVVGLRRRANGVGESTSVGVEGKSAESGVGRASASDGVPNSAADASLDDGALALTIGLAVDLGRYAGWDGESTNSAVVGQTAQSRVSRTTAGNGVPGSSAQASLDDWALASAGSLVVSLRRRARRHVEGADIGHVGKSAKSGVGRASTSGSVPNSAAQASQDNWALASAVGIVVGLRRVASGEAEGASVGVEGKSAKSGVGGALASDGVPNSAAEASGDRRALALTIGLAVDLR